MASANFNTQIVSSNSDSTLQYDLDRVITKNFLGNPGYNYTLNRNVPTPIGVTIENRMDLGSYLIIPGLLEFELSIIVSDNDRLNPIQVTATTIVTIDGRPSFSNEITKFFESENYTQKKDETIQNWSSIISNRISSGDLVDGPVRP